MSQNDWYPDKPHFCQPAYKHSPYTYCACHENMAEAKKCAYCYPELKKDQSMTRDEWTRKLMIFFAGGHQSDYLAQQARDWLAGKDPPVADDWEPTAKKKHEENKAEK